MPNHNPNERREPQQAQPGRQDEERRNPDQERSDRDQERIDRDKRGDQERP